MPGRLWTLDVGLWTYLPLVVPDPAQPIGAQDCLDAIGQLTLGSLRRVGVAAVDCFGLQGQVSAALDEPAGDKLCAGLLHVFGDRGEAGGVLHAEVIDADRPNQVFGME